MKKISPVSRQALAVVVLFFLLGAFVLIYQLLKLPQPDEFLALAKDYIEKYGTLVLFVAAVAEGILAINWYLPGSVVIVLGVSLAAGDPVKAIELVSIVTLGFVVTALLNYVLGYLAWYRFLLFLGLRAPLQKAKGWFTRWRLAALYIGFFHPNVGALIATSCGIFRYPPVWFVVHSVVAIVVWNALWGLVAYHIGPVVLQFMQVWMVLPLFALWGVFMVYRKWRRRSRRDTGQGGYE